MAPVLRASHGASPKKPSPAAPKPKKSGFGNCALVVVFLAGALGFFLLSTGLTDEKQLLADLPAGEGFGDKSLFVKNPAGVWLRTYKWAPKGEPKGIVYIAHGFGEHANRQGYHKIANMLNKEGFLVHAHDHQGHGKSGGYRAYAESFGDFVTDTAFMAKRVRDSKLPMFLFGHSMGGLIAVHTAQNNKDLFKGVVLSGVALHIDEAVATPFLKGVVRQLCNLLPKLPVGDPLDSSHVSRSKDAAAAYVADPLNYHGAPKARFASGFLDHIENFDAAAFDAPFLTLHGGEDKLCKVEGSTMLYEKAASKDKSIKIFPGMYHEMFEDPESQQFYDAAVSWIVERV